MPLLNSILISAVCNRYYRFLSSYIDSYHTLIPSACKLRCELSGLSFITCPHCLVFCCAPSHSPPPLYTLLQPSSCLAGPAQAIIKSSKVLAIKCDNRTSRNRTVSRISFPAGVAALLHSDSCLPLVVAVVASLPVCLRLRCHLI